MGQFFQKNFMTNKSPLIDIHNKTEDILIEVPGNWVPECEIIFYGLMNSKYANGIYRIREQKMINPAALYRDMCYFNSNALINYLCSKDIDDMVSQPDEVIQELVSAAIAKYMYVPCSETMLRHSILEMCYKGFVRSINLVFPWKMREIDIQFLSSTIPQSIAHKINFINGQMEDVLAINKTTFTTIVINSLELANKLIDDPDRFRTHESFILLRNSSDNVSMTKNENGEYMFEETGTMKIMEKLVDTSTGMPKSGIRFARYEPMLFEDGMHKLKSPFVGM